MNASTALATWLVDRLVEYGVEQVVLCPGSRNAPLSFALAAHPAITLHTRIDERTAAFLALGIAKSSRRPAAVVTTSGTATANLHPAVLEAAHAGIDLIAVTADRPAALRGTGANQTTDQRRLYGDAAAFCDLTEPDDDAVAAAWHPGGPIQVNVQFVEPLVPDPVPDGLSAHQHPPLGTPGLTSRHAKLDASAQTAVPAGLRAGPRTVVVAGDDAGPRARVLAEEAGWPLLAEPTSGARNGANAIRTYRLLLGTELGDRVERAVVFGHPTLSRPVTRLLSRDDVEIVSVRARGRWPDRPFAVDAEYERPLDGPQAPRQRATSATSTAQGDLTGDDDAWLEEWRAADRELSQRLDRFVAERPGLTPHEVAAEVNAAVPPDGLLYVGASNPIRDLDLMARPYPVGQHRLLLANRGLAGIDGTLSSAIGAVLGRPRTSRAIAYLGDVTFLHDLTGLIAGTGQQRPDLTIVVANDDGGSIFATLEQGAPEYADRYDQLFGTPHGTDLASLCQSLRIPHWRVDSRAELAHALARPNGGIDVVEARIGRDDRRELDAAIRALVTRTG